MQGSNVQTSPCSKCQAANCFALSFTRISQEILLCFTFVATDVIVQDRIYLGSLFVSTPSARGENFINLDSLIWSSDRCSEAVWPVKDVLTVENRTFWGTDQQSTSSQRSINTMKVSTYTVTQRINACYAHGSRVTCLMPQRSAVPGRPIALLGWRVSKSLYLSHRPSPVEDRLFTLPATHLFPFNLV
jgi:hypothetical protein